MMTHEEAGQMNAITGRDIAALLNPRLAVLVTCCAVDGRPNVLTVVWHTPLSHEPPLIGISIGDSRYSNELIRQTGEFAINIVGQTLRQSVLYCGNHSGQQVDKIGAANLSLRAACTIKPPVLQDALGVLECRVQDRVSVGDHTLYVGHVLHAEGQSTVFSNAWEAAADNNTPLLCLQRDRFGAFLEGVVDNVRP